MRERRFWLRGSLLVGTSIIISVFSWPNGFQLQEGCGLYEPAFLGGGLAVCSLTTFWEGAGEGHSRLYFKSWTYFGLEMSMSDSEVTVPDPQPWKQTCMYPVMPTVYPVYFGCLNVAQHHLRWP